MSILMVNALVRLVKDGLSTQGRIQRFTEPHAHLMGGCTYHRIIRWIGSEQNGMCFARGRKDQCQGHGKEYCSEKTSPRDD
jgi:hypothetical protein